MSAIDNAIQQIENEIVANNNHLITADVLRPLLVGLANAIRQEIGKIIELNTNANNLVDAINEVRDITDNLSGVVIHQGDEDPNENPPSSFKLGDFYARFAGIKVINFYLYNGIQWIEIKN